MQNGDVATVSDAVGEIAELLATAYLRYSKLAIAEAAPSAIRSTQTLDNTGEPSPHGLTLTGQRVPGKDSAH